MFNTVPTKPYQNLWLSLIIGLLLSAIGIGTVQYLFFGASIQVIFEWFSALGVLLPIGAVVLVVYAMPVMWLLLKANLAGPVSSLFVASILFILFITLFEHRFPVYVSAVCVSTTTFVFMYLSYSKMSSNKAHQHGRS